MIGRLKSGDNITSKQTVYTNSGLEKRVTKQNCNSRRVGLRRISLVKKHFVHLLQVFFKIFNFKTKNTKLPFYFYPLTRVYNHTFPQQIQNKLSFWQMDFGHVPNQILFEFVAQVTNTANELRILVALQTDVLDAVFLVFILFVAFHAFGVVFVNTVAYT